MTEGLPLHIYVDADACPVKEEVYRVARRYDLGVTLVAGSWMNTPTAPDFALAGETIGGPPPFGAHDRSRFLQALDRAIPRLRSAPTRRDGPGQPREV
jgi:uncharacterized protein YaiI (UPF0178 family)